MATPPLPPQQPGAGPYGPSVPGRADASGGPVFTGPQQPYGAYAAHPRPGRYGCTLCGAWPAAPATVRGHQGLIVLMRFLSLRGRSAATADSPPTAACPRTPCGRAGGVRSFFITPVTLLMNLGPRAAFRRLTPPAGGYRPALAPGRPAPGPGAALPSAGPARPPGRADLPRARPGVRRTEAGHGAVRISDLKYGRDEFTISA
ncbi:hypothetical protein [Streptomyces sp. NBC_01294]|uniref:hypothetical protein n=1 Tax=Streptomyces sp. NBC_01294 TaxID=2903815 RepID=UPI002DD7F1FB|nr:hypothetical protein [Streptomyces sp. NBC_01294]WRZ60628.1 hypothetical protein OG534_31570 [Streptomyces sp. NBC_01294]